MSKEIISTSKAPQAIGPYSQGVQAGPFLFVSGQIAMDPTTSEMQRGDIRSQTELVLNHIKSIVEAAGGSMSQIVKTTIFLKNLSDFSAVNEVYAGYFENQPPARATVEVSALPKDAEVEIEAVAYLG